MGICLTCGDDLETNSTQKKFCSFMCKRDFDPTKFSEQDPVYLTCPACGVEGRESYFYEGYCSKRCRRKEKVKNYNAISKAKQATPESRYAVYKRGAEIRNKDFNITLEEFMEFWQKPCFYCGDPIATIGLDRSDNSIGYHKDNLIPCCTICNLTKRNRDKAEFINHCMKIIAHQKAQKLNNKMVNCSGGLFQESK